MSPGTGNTHARIHKPTRKHASVTVHATHTHTHARTHIDTRIDTRKKSKQTRAHSHTNNTNHLWLGCGGGSLGACGGGGAAAPSLGSKLVGDGKQVLQGIHGFELTLVQPPSSIVWKLPKNYSHQSNHQNNHARKAQNSVSQERLLQSKAKAKAKQKQSKASSERGTAWLPSQAQTLGWVTLLEAPASISGSMAYITDVAAVWGSANNLSLLYIVAVRASLVSLLCLSVPVRACDRVENAKRRARVCVGVCVWEITRVWSIRHVIQCSSTIVYFCVSQHRIQPIKV